VGVVWRFPEAKSEQIKNMDRSRERIIQGNACCNDIYCPLHAWHENRSRERHGHGMLRKERATIIKSKSNSGLWQADGLIKAPLCRAYKEEMRLLSGEVRATGGRQPRSSDGIAPPHPNQQRRRCDCSPEKSGRPVADSLAPPTASLRHIWTSNDLHAKPG
jgi:hypothetical protein